MSDTIKGEITIRKAVGTSFSDPRAKIAWVDLPTETDADVLVDTIVEATDSGVTLTGLLPDTVYGIFVKNAEASGTDEITVVASGAGTPATLGAGDVWGAVGVDVTALTLTGSSGDTPAAKVVIWGKTS